MKSSNIPQGYKMSPLGVIPQDWEVRRLGEVATISSGGTPSREKKEYWDGDIPWITTSLVNMPMIYFADEHITELGLNESSAKILKAQTILMAMYGQGNTRGKVSMLKIIASTNQACAAIVPINQIEEYIYYYLDSKYQTIRDLSNDGGQKNLSLGIIKEFKIILPPLVEQERIAEVLGTWDEAIDKQSQLVKALERRKRALMQQLLTARKRLPNFSAPWQDVKLGDICKISTGKLDANAAELNGEYPFFTCAKKPFRINKFAFDTEAILVAGNGEHLGYVHYFKGKFNAYQRTYILDEFSENIFFIMHYLQKHLKSRINKTKSSSNTPYIVLSSLSDMELKLPTIEEQKAIAQILTTADREIKLTTTKLNSLRTQKRALMQQLLTGKKQLKI